MLEFALLAAFAFAFVPLDGIESTRSPLHFNKSVGSVIASGFVDLAGHLDAAEAIGVLGDSAVEGLCDALPVLAGLQTVFVRGV